jgi:hypothetical protein
VHAVNNVVEIRMQQRFAAANGNNRRSQFLQLVYPAQHLRGCDRLGKIVEFVAISARQIAPANRNQVSKQGMVRGRHGFQNLPDSVRISFQTLDTAAKPSRPGNHRTSVFAIYWCFFCRGLFCRRLSHQRLTHSKRT